MGKLKNLLIEVEQAIGDTAAEANYAIDEAIYDMKEEWKDNARILVEEVLSVHDMDLSDLEALDYDLDSEIDEMFDAELDF